MLARVEAAWWRLRRRFSGSEWAVRRLRLGVSKDPAHAHGLLMIQIDGLGREQLERAMKRGRMPFLRRLLKQRGYALHTAYSGIPSSTPAVQGELYYGAKCAVPAFSFLDRRVGEIGVMMHPDWAKRIEEDLQSETTGLLTGGSSWSNIYTGGASQQESHFCGASIGLGDMWRTGKLRTILTFAFLHFPAFVRVMGLLVLELFIGLWDVVRGATQGYELKREFLFLIARVFVCVGLREMVTLGGRIDVARGLPIVHVNFLGYDEQSHRRGPSSAFAHWSLRGIDRAIRQLYSAAKRSGRRDYDVWIFSDHGQARARQFGSLVEGGLEGLLRKHWPHQEAVQGMRSMRPQQRPSPGHWIGGPRAGRRENAHRAQAKLSAFEKQEFAVAAMGPVGHIYFGRELGADETRRLAAALVRDGVPGILIRRDDERIDWLHAGGEMILPDHYEALPHDQTLKKEIADDLVRLVQSTHAGELVVLGFGPKGERWTFAAENGAHAGPAPEEVQAFAALPAGTWLPEGTEHFIRMSALRLAALRVLGRDPVAASHPAHVRRRRLMGPVGQLRVATYNVHSCHGCDGRVSPGRIARVLERIDADIVALQELDSGRERSRGEDQLAMIAEKLGMHPYYCPAVTHGAGQYGHGILSREPLRLVRRAALPRGKSLWKEPREAVWVTFSWSEQDVHLIGTHLGLGSSEQAAQVADLLAPSWLGGIGGDQPLILCGDFNLPPGSPEYRRLTAALRDVQAHAPRHVAQQTFPSFWPVRRIDHIFVSPHFDVVAVRVPRDDLTRKASDHLPLVADLMLPIARPATTPSTAAPAASADRVTEGV
jgi:endonuclease/exonuclease/phosphatase family metal-dependent hydrolase